MLNAVNVLDTLRRHWPLYLMEAAGLAAFISSACLITTLVDFPGSPVRQAVGNPVLRRGLIGVWMGLTIAAITYAPWGQRTGAHINPAVTWAFRWLGKMTTWDAVFYTLAQFLGGIFGVSVMAALLARWIANPAVNFVVTEPGPAGMVPKYSPWAAFAGEFVISFLLMYVLLQAIASKRWERWVGALAGVLILTYIVLETPLSSMSLNPARTFASALAAHSRTAIWVYFTAPILSMLLAAELCRRQPGAENILHFPKDEPANDECSIQK